MKKKASLTALATLAALTTLATTAPAFAQDTGTWLVRARAVHLDSANKDGTPLGLSINNKWLPEVDISYFFSPQLAAELILTVPQKQTVHSTALDADIGSFKHLPPTLTLQYHFTGLGAARPYLGAGLNYTRISSVRLAGGAADLQRDSVGLALQVGVDVALGGGWLLNADLKKVKIDTEVRLNGVSQGTFKVDPLLLGIGLGRRF